MKCPNCGYERQARDDEFGIIPSSECPQCRAIYEKVAIVEPAKEDRKEGEKRIALPGTLKDAQNVSRGISARHVIAVCMIILVILAVRFFVFNKKTADVPALRLPVPSSENSARQDQPGQEPMRMVPIERQNGASPTGQPLYPSVQALVKNVNSAIVLIKTNMGTGSGFFVNGGNVITNHHVLRGASSAQVTAIDGTVHSLNRILAEDVEGDLAIFSVDGSVTGVQPLAVNPALPEQGENVVVIGNPYGLEHSVSTGIVSAVREDKAGVRWIQLTAPISPGNSGGPVLNMRGEVIGVASSVVVGRGAQNINFAVSGERVARLSPGYGFPLSQLSSRSPSGGSGRKEVYCYLDAGDNVHFVDWRTEVLLSKPDGSLDRKRYADWVLDRIGGDPDRVNPAQEAQSYIDEHRKEMYERIFRTLREEQLTLAQRQFWLSTLNRASADAYNRAVARKNGMVIRYNTLMNAFDEFANRRN